MNKPRILVVDDEPNLSELVRRILDKTGTFEVRVENRAALALAAAREFRPDMILLDVDMPGKDGGQVAREIEADPTLRHASILFLTSLISHAEAGEHEIVRGGKRYLAKPVNSNVLIRTMHRLLLGEAYVA